MKITEITNESRKIIKRLQNLYLSYSINVKFYSDLMNFIEKNEDTTDVDIRREIDIIRTKLYNEIIIILGK